MEFEENDDELRVIRHVHCSINVENKLEQLSIPVQVNQEGPTSMQREELTRVDLVSQGILKESRSPWASPAVIVIRKDGGFVFAVIKGDLIRSRSRTLILFPVWRSRWML